MTSSIESKLEELNNAYKKNLASNNIRTAYDFYAKIFKYYQCFHDKSKFNKRLSQIHEKAKNSLGEKIYAAKNEAQKNLILPLPDKKIKAIMEALDILVQYESITNSV